MIESKHYRLFIRGIFLLLLSFSTGLVFGQVSYNSTFFANAGNPGGTTFGETSTAGWTDTGLPTALSANQWSPVIALPFAFDFYGTPVTNFKVSANGLLTFSTGFAGAPANVNTSLPNAALPDNTIAVMWDEFTSAAPTGTNDRVYYQTFGAAPNRQLWVYWFSFEYGNPFVSFQYFAAVLEETTNKVYVVDLYGSASPLLTATVGVQKDATTGLDAGSTLAQDGNGTSNADNDYWEFAPFQMVANNAAMTSIDDPVLPFCAGVQNVSATLFNQGTNTINSVDINWSVNGVAQTPVNLGPTLGLASNASMSVPLGTYNFLPNVNYTIVVNSTNPNGTTDPVTSNDTISVVISAAMAGTYSINSAVATGGSNFQSFNDAATALNTKGICSAVVFNVVQGTYNEQIVLADIAGASTTNTITFQPDAANTAAAILSNGATGTANNYVIQFDGTKYTTVQGLSLVATGTTYGRVLEFSGANESINILNNTITSPTTSSTSNNSALIYHNTGSANRANRTVINGNTITGGSYAIYTYGISTSDFEVGNRITNNIISDFYYYGIYNYYQDSSVIDNNQVYSLTSGANTTLYGIYNYYSDNSSVQKNKVVLNGPTTIYGIYAYYNDATAAGPTIYANNMISCLGTAGTGTIYGLYTFNSYYQNIYHNSILVTGGSATAGRGMYINSSTSGTYGFVNIMNNNVVNTGGGYAMEATTATNTLGYINNMNNNNWYATGATVVRYGTTNHATLAAYQAAVPAYDANSVSGDPLYSANDDLHVNAALVNNAGATGLGITTDFDGDIRCPGGGCPGASSNPDIGADEFAPATNNAYPIDLIAPMADCGNSTQNVLVTVGNLGLSPITSINMTVNITGAMTTTLSGTFATNIPSASYDTINIGTINTNAGGVYNFEIITQLSGDADNTNDTLRVTLSIDPSNAPTAIHDTICSGSTATLSATPDVLGTGFAWYDAATGGNLVGTGATFTTPALTADSTFYTQYLRARSLETTYAAGNGCGGGNMFNISATNTVILNALQVSPRSNTTVTVYYIANGTYLGNETNSAAWTLLGTVPNISTNATFAIPSLTIPAGQTYAIYVEYDADYSSLSSTYSNSDITITTGAGLCSSFGGVNAGRTFNGTVHYFAAPCNPVRTPVTAFVRQIAATASATDATCLNADGTATATGTAGTAPFTYVWSNGATTATATGLVAANYFATVTDAIGCQAITAASVGSSPGTLAATAAASDATCTAANGSATASETGGNAPFSYLWSNGATTATATGLVAANYNVTVTDANGCEASASVTVASAPGNLAANAAATDAICLSANGSVTASETGGTAPFSYAWSNAGTTATISGLSAGTFTVTISDANGCESTATATVNTGTGNLAANAAATDAICLSSNGTATATETGGTAPFNYAWSNAETTAMITGLSAGTFSVTITDDNGCEAIASATVNTGTGNLAASASATDVVCLAANGTASATETGGTAPFNYAWSTGESTSVIVNLVAGTYTVTITDDNGCESIASATVNSLAGTLSATASVTDASINGAADGAIDLTVAGGTAPFSFVWSNGETTEDISGLVAGTYTVTVTGANGCESISSATVSQPPVAIDNIEAAIVLNIYPNPAQLQATVDLTLTKVADVEIRLVSVTGQVMQLVQLTQVDAVTHILNLQDLPAGLYMVQIVSDNQVITRRLVVTRN